MSAASSSADPARRVGSDRLTAALFLAAAFHLIVLLGVGFRGVPPKGALANELDVVLIRDDVADETPNPTANYLANASRRGSGTALDVGHAQAPGDTAPTGAGGSATGGGDHADGAADDDTVTTRLLGRERAAAQAVAQGERSPLVVVPASREDTGLDAGDVFALRGAPSRELAVTANTRAAAVSTYVDAWRHRIERIGTANYPLDAVRRAGLTGSPVVEARIAADGRLVDAVVARSSGHVILDQAALNILRLAAPFEPFPAGLTAAHDSLRLRYEWQFANGEWRDSTVGAPSKSP